MKPWARGRLQRDALLLLAVALAALGFMGFSAGRRAPGAVARVERGGEILARLPLDTAAERSFEFDAGFNTVVVEGGAVRVAEADCPDQVCVRQGPVSWAGAVLACVPHGLLIVVEGGAPGADVDAVTR